MCRVTRPADSSEQTKFYRHMRFLDHGYVLYNMDVIDPYDIPRYLTSGLPQYRRIYEGRYQLSGKELIVEVSSRPLTCFLDSADFS